MKKILAVALSVIMLLGIIPFAAMAAGETDFVFDFEASTTEVKAGDVVDVTLNVTGTEDAQTVGWQFELVLPEGLEYVDNSAVMNAETKALYNAGEFSFENSTKVMVCVEANGEALKNTAGTHEIMTFKLKVADDAKAGDEYTFELLDFLVMDDQAGELDMALVKLNIDTLTVVDHICSADKLTFVEVTDADCVNDGNKAYYECECGLKYADAEAKEPAIDVIIPALGHTKAAESVKENEVAADCENEGSYDEVVYCSVCGEELSRDTITVDALGHTEGEAVKENEVAADCENEGSYDEVVYCTVCGEELSRDTITTDALGHDYEAVVTDPTCTEAGYTTYTCSVCGDEYTADETQALGHTEGEVVYENVSDATCTEGGSGDAVVYCSVCGVELSRETTQVPALGHTEGEAVKENEVAADCENDGSYDSVVYCTVCGAEVSRETITVPALGHTEAEAVEENRKEADCVNAGSYDMVVYCSVCGEELSRESFTIDALGHKEAEAVEENRKEADCVNAGSYDMVVYCSVCGEELSRETTTIDALGHDYEAVVTAPDCVNAGYTTYTCTVCGDSYKADEVAALGHTEGEWVEDGTVRGKWNLPCSVCGEILDSEIRLVPVEGVELDQDYVEPYYVRKAPAFTLTETVLPEDAEKLPYTVEWSSSNEKVVTVDEDGNVTTHKRGCATITVTVTMEDGTTFTDTCNVKVKYTWWQWLIWFFLLGCCWYFV